MSRQGFELRTADTRHDAEETQHRYTLASNLALGLAADRVLDALHEFFAQPGEENEKQADRERVYP